MDIRKLFSMLALLMFTLVGTTACSDDDEVAAPQALPVNYANLDGTWQLTQWQGAPLAEGSYCYISFSRRDKTFSIYQKLDSMYARLITGSFTIEEDERLGYLVSGTYDYGRGPWANTYIVTDLLAAGSMTWTVKDDATDVSLYTRCPDGVPEEVVAEARP